MKYYPNVKEVQSINNTTQNKQPSNLEAEQALIGSVLVNNDVINDFNLFRYCKHFIVGPSSFHWWGAWLNENPNKICIRPIDINPSNNENFWPKDWFPI